MSQITVGIDKIGFYTSDYFLDLKTLAAARGIPSERFYAELGQYKMAMCPPGEDVVTMGANAAASILQGEDANNISMLLFATESGIDFSKAAGIYVHRLLSLPAHCRVVELKQACYGATCGLQLAMSYLQQFPDKKILLIASDVARYKMHSSGESSQGCGAVAMLLTANPRTLVIEPESGFYVKDVMDFWRPNYCEEAFVDGKLSCNMYLRTLEATWHEYSKLSSRNYFEHQLFCYHTPVPKLVERAHLRLAKINQVSKEEAALYVQSQLADSLYYCREIGNCYTASLYLGVISLLENNKQNLAGKRIGLYSYGSGCVGEYFSALIQDSYHDYLLNQSHQKLLQNRTELSYEQYEDLYNFKLVQDGSSFLVPTNYQVGKFRLAAIDKHQRIYVPSSKD